MRASIAQLEAFYWIARLGSFHAAARHMHLTQPTVSGRIAELEATLGTRLFDRTHQRAELTTHGRAIVDSVDRLLKLSDDIALHSQSSRTLRGLLRVGAVESVALMTLPKLLPRFVARYPDLKIELTLDVSSALNRKLNAKELDLAVLTDPEVGDGITVQAVGLIELAWFAAPHTSLPDRPLTPADLAGMPILTMPSPSTIFRAISAWFDAAGIEPAHLSTCNSLALMARLVAAGQGVAVLPTAMVRNELDAGQLRLLHCAMAVPSGTLVVAFWGPVHRYRPLVATITEALHESTLVAPLGRIAPIERG
ncbi:LysR family transcriptional regulator [Burkholderiales bacterium 8X]|nr:LysR family transcriptional regulator [Burkholderiales bacterium 8X]